MKKTRYDIHVEMKAIIRACSDFFNVPPDVIFSHTRKREILIPRQWIMYFFYEITLKNVFSLNSVLSYIQKNYGFEYHHTSLLHSKNKVKDFIDAYKEDKLLLAYLRKEIDNEILKDKISRNNNYMCFKSQFKLKRIKSIEIQ